MLGVALLLYAGFGRGGSPRCSGRRCWRPSRWPARRLIIGTEALGLMPAGARFGATGCRWRQPQTIRSGGIAQLFSGGELIEVGTGLTIAVFALLGMSHDWTPDEARTEAEPEPMMGTAGDRHDRGQLPRRSGAVLHRPVRGLTRRNLIKIVMGLSLMETSTYLLFISMAYRARLHRAGAAQPAPGHVAGPARARQRGRPGAAELLPDRHRHRGRGHRRVPVRRGRIAQHYRTLDADGYGNCADERRCRPLLPLPVVFPLIGAVTAPLLARVSRLLPLLVSFAALIGVRRRATHTGSDGLRRARAGALYGALDAGPRCGARDRVLRGPVRAGLRAGHGRYRRAAADVHAVGARRPRRPRTRGVRRTVPAAAGRADRVRRSPPTCSTCSSGSRSRRWPATG